MVNRTIHLIHLICSLAFLIGIVVTVVFWIDNSIEFNGTISNNSVIIISYIFGSIAIVSHFINNKSTVKKQVIDNRDEKEHEKINVQGDQIQSLVDYSF